MTDYQKQADEIHNDYLKNRIINSAFQDAVVSFLWLIARVIISNAAPTTGSKKGK